MNTRSKIARAPGHLERDRCDGNAGDITENTDGSQNPRCKRNRNQAALCTQPVISAPASDNTYDGRYDALGTGNDIIDRAGQSGAADKAAAFHRDCDMSELVRQALDQFFA